MKLLFSIGIFLLSMASYSQTFFFAIDYAAGTLSPNKFMEEHSLNISMGAGCFLEFDHFNIGLTGQLFAFPKFDNLNDEFELHLYTAGIEANLFSIYNHGFFIGAKVDYPLLIQELETPSAKKIKHLMPAFKTGYSWEKTEFYLSYKRYGYSNNYTDDQSNNLPVQEINMNVLQLGLKYKLFYN